MIKLKQINITGIRGIKDSISLSLDKKSLLVYGDNGTGKSSITDAIEWFYKDKIAHLSGNEIGKESIRNIFISDLDDSKVEFQFSDNKLDTEKSIDSSYKIFNSNSSKELYNYFEESISENLFLRYRDLTRFIVATKGDRLKELQPIIGFSQVLEMRGLLKKFANKFAKDIKAANFSNKKSNQQSILMESLGQNITSDTQFFEIASKLILPLKLKKDIKSFNDARFILKSIAENDESVLADQISFYNKIADTLKEVNDDTDTLISLFKEYLSSYSELKKDAEKINNLQLLSLLTEGLNVLKKDIVKEDFCPLCQQDKNKLDLIKELQQRIESLSDVKKEKDIVAEKAASAVSVLQDILNAVNSLSRENLLKEKENIETSKIINALKDSMNNISIELKKDIFSVEPPKETSLIQVPSKDVTLSIGQAKRMAKELTESAKGNLKLQIHTKLSRSIDAYIAFRKIEKEQELLTAQQYTFESLYTDFVKRQEDALNSFLNMFSGDINKFYTLMNPNERVDDIRLIPIKDKYDELDGITISYNFYDKKLSPPSSLLSESHINCLGLAFFLASVKAFNKVNDFFLLDDVISSFDGHHRTRFIRLLTDEFSKYQILLLTHEKDFFEIASSEAKRKGWVIKSLSWSADKGVGFETPLADLKTKIEEKFKTKNIDGLGNDIRKYAERQLKQIALNIEADLPFRFNDHNEERMMNELLSGIQGKINKYSPTDLKTKHNIDSLLASPMLIGNKTSHDNTFKENIDDLDVFWEDIKKLIKTLYCSEEKCKSFISVGNFDSVNKQIRCNCGKLSYMWNK
jgi:hypothetical protein